MGMVGRGRRGALGALPSRPRHDYRSAPSKTLARSDVGEGTGWGTNGIEKGTLEDKVGEKGAKRGIQR